MPRPRGGDIRTEPPLVNSRDFRLIRAASKGSGNGESTFPRNRKAQSASQGKSQGKAQGRRIRITLNGHVIVDADLDSVKDPEVLKKHPGLARARGHIGFLGHGSRVEFQNIRIKELP